MARAHHAEGRDGFARRDPGASGGVERDGPDAEARLRANPSVDHKRGATREDHILRREPVSLTDAVTAVAGGFVDQIAASLTGEFQEHVRVDHGADRTGQ